MIETSKRFAQAFLGLSLLVTLAELGRERANDYLFTLIGLILFGTAAPYLASFAVMKRVPARWAGAIGIAVALFGAVDVPWRMQAFFFPTDTSYGSMAIWLPLSSVWAVPLVAVIAHTFLTVFRDGAP